MAVIAVLLVLIAPPLAGAEDAQRVVLREVLWPPADWPAAYWGGPIRPIFNVTTAADDLDVMFVNVSREPRVEMGESGARIRVWDRELTDRLPATEGAVRTVSVHWYAGIDHPVEPKGGEGSITTPYYAYPEPSDELLGHYGYHVEVVQMVQGRVVARDEVAMPFEVVKYDAVYADEDAAAPGVGWAFVVPALALLLAASRRKTW